MAIGTETTTSPTEPGNSSAVSEGMSSVQEHAGATVGAAKEQAQEVVGSAIEHAQSFVHSATDEVRDQGRQQTERLSGSLHEISEQLDQMASAADGSSPATTVVRSLAEVTESVSKRLEQGGPEGLMSDVSRFARRRPGTFLALSAASGFVLARLVRNVDTSSLKAAVSDGARTEHTDDAPLSAGGSSGGPPGTVAPTAIAEPDTAARPVGAPDGLR